MAVFFVDWFFLIDLFSSGICFFGILNFLSWDYLAAMCRLGWVGGTGGVLLGLCVLCFWTFRGRLFSAVP